MKIFNKKKSPDYVDLTSQLEKHDKKKKAFIPQKTNSEGLVDLTDHLPKEDSQPKSKTTEENSNSGFFGFFSQQPKKEPETQTDSQEEKKKRLVKRILDLTNRMEEQEKEIYSLQQRLEVLERKQKLGY